jgi:hypothetical protein
MKQHRRQNLKRCRKKSLSRGYCRQFRIVPQVKSTLFECGLRGLTRSWPLLLRNFHEIFFGGQPGGNLLGHRFGTVLPYRALPDNGDPPPGILQGCQFAKIARNRFTKLLRPERLIGTWGGRVGAVLVPVPEAAVHLNGGPVFRKHDIRLSREFSRMKPEAKPKPMKRAPQRQLRLRVDPLDARHHAGARYSVDNIHHVNFSWRPGTFYRIMIGSHRFQRAK